MIFYLKINLSYNINMYFDKEKRKKIRYLIRKNHPNINKSNPFYLTLYQHYYNYNFKFKIRTNNNLTIFF